MRLRDSALTDELLKEIPKAQLHIHIAGSFELEIMFEIAASNGVRLYERDFYELTFAYLQKAASQGVRHAEIFFDPQAHTIGAWTLGR